MAVPAGYVLWRKGLLRPFLGGLWISAVVYVAVVYVGALISVTANPLQAWLWTWDWHVKAAAKISSAIPHGWGSPWWSWPIMLRPIRYFYGVNAEGLLQVVIAIGNPLIWWSGTLAVAGRHLRRGAQGRIQEALGGRPDDTDRPRLRVLSWRRGCRAPAYRTSTTTCRSTPSPSWPWPTGCSRSGTAGMGTLGGRRLRRLRRGARCILPSPGHSAAHKRRRPHEPRVDRLLVPLREARSRERLPGPEPHLSMSPVRLIPRGERD